MDFTVTIIVTNSVPRLRFQGGCDVRSALEVLEWAKGQVLGTAISRADDAYEEECRAE